MTSPNPRNRAYDDEANLSNDENDAGADSESFPAQFHGGPPLHDIGDRPHFAPDAPPLHSESAGTVEESADLYDPVWTGQGEISETSGAVTQADLDRIEEILSSEHFRIRRKRAEQNEFVPPPPPPAQQKKNNPVMWAAGTFVLLVAASAFIAYQATERVPLLDGASDAGGVMSRVASLFATPQAEQAEEARDVQLPPLTPPRPPVLPPPSVKAHLVVTGASADSPDRILLGVAAGGTTDGMNAVIGGLVPGTTLSAGKPWGSTGWILPAGELATAYLRPPAGFSGTMEYSVALHRPDNSVIDRQTMRLEWASPNVERPAQPEQTQQAAAPAPQQPVQQPEQAAPRETQARGMAPEEVGALLARGEELLVQGDIASARLLLQRAADAQDARAAFALAATYDPIELKRLGVYGAAPDVVKARDWYEKAKQYGSREAPKRLELLASQFR